MLDCNMWWWYRRNCFSALLGVEVRWMYYKLGREVLSEEGWLLDVAMGEALDVLVTFVGVAVGWFWKVECKLYC